MIGIGPKLPLRRDSEHGFYGLTTTFPEQINQNFKNLLLTSPGERVMNPDFGIGLRNFLFEKKSDAIPKIRQRIINQTKKYLPFIEVNKISFDQDLSEDFAKDSQILNLSIDYSIPGLNLNTSLVLSTDGTNKI
tara:strand:+ start:13877 stop:14278 length:402 start_codon:yes stop_codon:yes gene_type:complete